jgi:hypothetical protein
VRSSHAHSPRRVTGALVLYAALAVAILARGVLAAPASRAVGDPGSDKTIFMWAFVWWPYALRHGHDPFVSHAVWVPDGIDLSWVTAVPGPSLLASPLTWAAGPVVTYNVLAVLAPALAAWTHSCSQSGLPARSGLHWSPATCSVSPRTRSRRRRDT